MLQNLNRFRSSCRVRSGSRLSVPSPRAAACHRTPLVNKPARSAPVWVLKYHWHDQAQVSNSSSLPQATARGLAQLVLLLGVNETALTVKHHLCQGKNPTKQYKFLFSRIKPRHLDANTESMPLNYLFAKTAFIYITHLGKRIRNPKQIQGLHPLHT